MKRGISVTHLESLLRYAKSEHDKFVPLERQALDLIIRELRSRRREGKKLRLKRNKQRKQIVNLAAKLHSERKPPSAGAIGGRMSTTPQCE